MVTQLDATFANSTALSDVDIRSANELINSPFLNCDAIKTLKIRDVNVTNDMPFQTYTTIKNLTLNSRDEIIADNLAKFSSLEYLDVPNATRMAPVLSGHLEYLSTVKIPMITEIPDNGFEFKQNLEEIDISSVQVINKDAFYLCDKLKRICAPNLQSIHEKAFQHCASLTTICAPELQRIHETAFAYCTALEEVFLPHPMLDFNDTPFLNCASLNSIHVAAPYKHTLNTKKINASVQVIKYDQNRPSCCHHPPGGHGQD